MGVAGLVLGILGAILCFFFPTFAWLLALTGIIVSAIAIKKGQGGIAIAGLVLSIVALVIAFPMFLCRVICASAAAGAAGWMGSF